MESRSNITLVTQVNLTKTLYKYAALVEEIATFISNDQYIQISDRMNQLIDKIQVDMETNRGKNPSLPQLQALLTDCLKTNKKNYCAYFNATFQASVNQENGLPQLSTFFSKQLNKARTYTGTKYYLQAISLCDALKSWLTEASQSPETDYQRLFQALLTHCSTTREYVYYHWLKFHTQYFMDYHYPTGNIKVQLFKMIEEIKQASMKKDYQTGADQCTRLIGELNSRISWLGESSSALMSAWRHWLVFQRQEIIFTWFIKESLSVAQQSHYMNLLTEDLLLLVKVVYFKEQRKWELHCKLFIINLLFCTEMERSQLADLREKLCLAFDIFNKQSCYEYKKTALSLLGLGLVNAYEGDKQDLLKAFKLALDYDPNLDNLTQAIIQQLPFYLEPVPYSVRIIANPLGQLGFLESTPAVPSSMRPY